MAKTKKENKTVDTEMTDATTEKANTKANPKASKKKESPKAQKESPKRKNQENGEDSSEEDVEQTKANGASDKKRKSNADSNSPSKLPKTGETQELYVGNLPYEISPDEVRTMLQEYGSLKTLDWKKYPGSEKFRGYCYATFTSVEALNKAVAGMDKKVLKGRQLKAEITHGPQERVSQPSKTLIVKNLPKDTQEGDVRSEFSKFGTITDIRILNDRVTGDFKRCMYVDFEDQDAATRANDAPPRIKGEEVDVDYAAPKVSRDYRTEGGSRGRRGGRGGFRGGRGGRGGRGNW